jgi:hypothetical protein
VLRSLLAGGRPGECYHLREVTAAGWSAGATGGLEGHRPGLFVLGSPFFSRKQHERQRRASGAEDPVHESIHERDRKHSAAVQRALVTRLVEMVERIARPSDRPTCGSC